MGNCKGHMLCAVFSLVKIHPQILFSFISELGNLAPPAAARGTESHILRIGASSKSIRGNKS